MKRKALLVALVCVMGLAVLSVGTAIGAQGFFTVNVTDVGLRFQYPCKGLGGIDAVVDHKHVAVACCRPRVLLLLHRGGGGFLLRCGQLHRKPAARARTVAVHGDAAALELNEFLDKG